jgi:hypothetical protein
MSGDIFVQIASYRDPELIPTLRDAIERARDPSRLHFCVAWQHDDGERQEELFGELLPRARFTILDIPHRESRGACWARNKIQQNYRGERYTLQLDSHHRFVDGWDDSCIEMLEDLRADGVAKPLLTAYLPSYDPGNDPDARIPEAWFLRFDRFIPEGAIFFLPGTIPAWRERKRAMRARFYSAHFAFADGSFVREVPHNPAYYFHGEEITLAVRAFTHGYDLFSPHRVVAWHEYTRRGRTKHWDDHADWGTTNTSTHASVRALFGMDEFANQEDAVRRAQRDAFGLGTQRTLEDYERYAGICFSGRGVTQAVLDDAEPSPGENAGTPYAAFRANCVPRFKHCIDIGYDRVPLDDYDFWLVTIKDESGNDLHRADAKPDEIQRMKADPDHYCKLWREFNTTVRPKSWLVWPHSAAHGWCPPIYGTLP